MPRPTRDLSRRSLISGSLVLLGSALLTPGLSEAAPAASDLDFASALAAARAIRAREVSSLELTEHVLDRISRFNPRINAIVTQTADAALARAREADEALARKEWWGPFHGVPCTSRTRSRRPACGRRLGRPFWPITSRRATRWWWRACERPGR